MQGLDASIVCQALPETSKKQWTRRRALAWQKPPQHAQTTASAHTANAQYSAPAISALRCEPKIQVARDAKPRPPCGMGAKYLPTIKDQKLGRRFQRNQLTQSKFIKPALTAKHAKKASEAKAAPKSE